MSIEKLSYIYKVTNILNGKIYIGKTINFKSRKKQHIYCAVKNKDRNKSHFYCSIRKYSKENFKWEIIYKDKCHKNKLNELEKFFIAYYESFGKNGYNMTIGGDGANSGQENHSSKTNMSKEKREENGRKMANTRKKNGTFITGALKTAKTLETKIDIETGLLVKDIKSKKISKTRKENGYYSGKNNPKAKKFLLIDSNRKKFYVHGGINKFCINHNISYRVLLKNIGKVIKFPTGKRKTEKRINTVGWVMYRI